MPLRSRPLLLTVLLFIFIVLPLGMLEGWYGRVDYSGDAIPYLDMARAVHNGDWKLAFNPLWGLGYALLIAFFETFFAATPAGEWNAIHLLNLLIYCACYFSFMFLLRTICRSIGPAPDGSVFKAEGRIVLAGTALFLCAELCIDRVSRVGPDTLITTLVLFAVGILLSTRLDATWTNAALLGLVLGCGIVVKTIFLPLSLVIIILFACILYRQRAHSTQDMRASYSLLLITIAVGAFFVVPYVAGLSWSFGRFTMGESGSINYAWHVNRLELMHWQGGPAQFGRPLHPTQLLLADPPVYGFSQPFNVSYPPFFNPPYYYEGYKHFFSLKLQLHALKANIFHLYQALRSLPITYAVLITFILILMTASMNDDAAARSKWFRDLLRLWQVWIPALAGMALYLQVHLEGRYLPAFLLVLSAVPISVFLLHAERWPSYTSRFVLGILILCSVGTLLKIDRSTIAAARHRVQYSDTSQWALARYLKQHGLVPGDAVAVIAGPSNHCTWAHVDSLRIVAELEVSLYAPAGTGENLFWDAAPQAQQKILDAFTRSGAKVVIARVTSPKEYSMPGWTAIPNTDDMVHTLAQ